MEASRELNELLNRSSDLLVKVNPNELCSSIEKLSSSRPGLSAVAFSHLRCFGPDVNQIIEPPSSDEASDPETASPSMNAIVDSLLDSYMACITESYKPSDSQPPALIFIHLDASVTAQNLTRIFRTLAKSTTKIQVSDFATERSLTHCGIVTLADPEEAQRLYDKFRIEQTRGTLAARLHTIPGAQRNVQVKWFINRALENTENWNAVVLRNLKRGCTVEEVQRVVNEPVVRIERPREVQGVWCTLVVMKNVEDCERICMNLNRRKLTSGGFIKAHVHPHSRFFRRPVDSHHRVFNSSLGKRPRLSSSVVSTKKSQKVEDVKILVSKIIQASSTPQPINTNPLAELVKDKSEDPPLEEGEIHEPLREVEELERTEHYRLFEFGGLSCTWDVGIVRHSGIYIKTSHANEVCESPFVE